MKNILTLVSLLLICTVACPQWVAQVSGNAAELRGVYFTDTQTGYVVGSDGTMIKTVNGGATWLPLNSGTIDTLRGVFFTDDTTGYASGAMGTIIKTTDAGNTWVSQTTGTTNLLRSLYFPSHDTGYCAGGGGVILKTTDGGTNWVQQTSTITQDLISIRFINSDTGWAASSLSTFLSGIVLKTIDGGTTWDTVYTDANGFLSVFCATADTVYAAGNVGTIVKTIDGGTVWNPLVSNSINILRGAFYTSADRGFVVGDGGDIMFTDDGGTTYTNQTIQINGLLGIYFPHPDTGYAVGALGTILKYSPICLPGPPPMPTSITGPQIVCANDTGTYYTQPVVNATSYAWTVPAGSAILSGQGDTLITVVYGSSSGTVGVSAVDSCGSSLPFTIAVTVNPAPAVPVISQNGDTLVSTAANFYQWYLNGTSISGATNQSYIVTQNGIYQVVVFNSFGCSSASLPFTVNNVGIEEQIIDGNTITVSESKHEVLFLCSEILLNAEIKIFDLSGKEIISSFGKSTREMKISKDKISKGIYFYVINSENEKTFSGKIMIQ